MEVQLTVIGQLGAPRYLKIGNIHNSRHPQRLVSHTQTAFYVRSQKIYVLFFVYRAIHRVS